MTQSILARNDERRDDDVSSKKDKVYFKTLEDSQSFHKQNQMKRDSIKHKVDRIKQKHFNISLAPKFVKPETAAVLPHEVDNYSFGAQQPEQSEHNDKSLPKDYENQSIYSQLNSQGMKQINSNKLLTPNLIGVTNSPPVPMMNVILKDRPQT